METVIGLDEIVKSPALLQLALGCVGDDHRHGEHRQYEYDVEEGLAAKRLVHQVSEQEAEHEAAQCRTDGERERAHDGPAEAGVGEHFPEQVEADKVCFRPRTEVYRPLVEGEVELQQQDRHQQECEQRNQREKQRQLEMPYRKPSRSTASFAGELRCAG